MKVAFAVVSIVVLAAAGGALTWSRAAQPKHSHRSPVAASEAPAEEEEGPRDPVPAAAPRASLPARAPLPPNLRVVPGPAPAGSGAPRVTIFNEVPEAEIPAHVQTLFESQSTTEWARGARASLEEKLDKVVAPNARLDSVECRADTCKVTTEFPDRAAQQAYFDKAYIGGSAAIASLNMSMYAHLSDTPDGVKSEVYLYNGGFP